MCHISKPKIGRLLPVCHAQHTSSSVLQFRMNFVSKIFPVNACTAPGMRGKFEWWMKRGDNSHQKAMKEYENWPTCQCPWDLPLGSWTPLSPDETLYCCSNPAWQAPQNFCIKQSLGRLELRFLQPASYGSMLPVELHHHLSHGGVQRYKRRLPVLVWDWHGGHSHFLFLKEAQIDPRTRSMDKI